MRQQWENVAIMTTIMTKQCSNDDDTERKFGKSNDNNDETMQQWRGHWEEMRQQLRWQRGNAATMTTMMTKQCRSDENTESKCGNNYADCEEIGKCCPSERSASCGDRANTMETAAWWQLVSSWILTSRQAHSVTGRITHSKFFNISSKRKSLNHKFL